MIDYMKTLNLGDLLYPILFLYFEPNVELKEKDDSLSIKFFNLRNLNCKDYFNEQ